MAYERINWKNRAVEKPMTYTAVENEDGTITLTRANGEVFEPGTPVNAENLNRMDDGIHKAHEMLTETERELLKRDHVVNLLDNSDFRNPVNQRGKTLYDTSGYTIDRWVLNNTSGSVTVNEDSITVANISSAGQAWFGQRVPNAARYVGKTVTLVAVRTDGTVHVKSGVVSETAAIGYNNGTDLSMRIEAVTTDTLRFNLVIMNPGESITFAYVALYEGAYTADTLPAYQYKGYAAELAECQQYFYVLPSDPFTNGYTIGEGEAALLTVQTPVSMRSIEPTLNLNGGALTIRCNGNDYHASAISAYGKIGCYIVYMVTAPGAPGMHSCSSYVGNANGNRVFLSCDL